MNKKIIASALLLIAVFLTGCENQTSSQYPENNTSSNSEISEVGKIEVIDFHGSRRCFSCLTIEKFTKETIEEFFQPELRDGKITFQSINAEESENQEIVQKYQARGSSLFINIVRNGKDNIEEDTNVWRLVRDEQTYKKYFKEKIESLLK